MKNIILIIQARMGSKRLPGKSMMELAGVPLISRIFERVSRCKTPNRIVLATTSLPSDDVLAIEAKKYSINVHRGSENDLVDRYYHCAKRFGADIVLRLPGDNPLPEPEEIDRLSHFHCQNEAAFSSNITNFMGNGYPDGIGIEAINIDALEHVWKNENNFSRREHVASNFVDYAAGVQVNPIFKVETLLCQNEIRRPDIVLDVNTMSEYLYIKQIYDYFMPKNKLFGIRDVIKWHDSFYKVNDLKG